MNIGIVVSKEFVSVDGILGPSRPIYKGKIKARYYAPDNEARNFGIYLVHCSIGEIAASAATQFLIDNFAIDLILNFGMAHSLNPDFTHPLTCIVERVVHYDFDVSLALGHHDPGSYPQFRNCFIPASQLIIEKLKENPALRFATCASGDKFILKDTRIAKSLHWFSPDICDMNCAATLLTCISNKMPCLIIKGVTDGFHNGIVSTDTIFDAAAGASFKFALEVLRSLT
ncbi:5'-methylthioadenosine/S-adenosylhomocysteine nucleosidase [Candidatus Saccharibacteria bacterium]|nr:5'-methylthioadenosine/S-adenosylhomocysteine nucleosidase [Candidatus Saccharibacteria bacterium]